MATTFNKLAEQLLRAGWEAGVTDHFMAPGTGGRISVSIRSNDHKEGDFAAVKVGDAGDKTWLEMETHDPDEALAVLAALGINTQPPKGGRS